jgi:putative DNA primase/helicase
MLNLFKKAKDALTNLVHHHLLAAIPPVLPAKPLAAAPTAAPHIRALLLHLCDQDQARADWVARWLALPLRRPDAKMMTALLVAGPSGCGKGLFFGKVMAAMYGQESAITSSEQLKSPFTGWMRNKRFIVADEANHRALSAAAIKNLITSRQYILNRKGRTMTLQDNKMNFVFTSGSIDFLPNIEADRRYFVLQPADAMPLAFAQAVAHEIEQGGIIDFYRYLLTLDMGTFNEHTAPMPAASAKEAA